MTLKNCGKMINRFIILFLILTGPGTFQSVNLSAQRIERIIGDSLTSIARDYLHVDTIRNVRIRANRNTRIVEITASDELNQLPYNNENVDRIYRMAYQHLGNSYPGYTIRVLSFQRDIRHLIPNFRREQPLNKRYYRPIQLTTPVVTHIDRPFDITYGLINRNIAVWNSHGLHNLPNDTLWGWQRPNLFQTVEDLLTTSFVIPFLVPMLENAGAQVYLPRERDVNPNEVIVDNDDHDDHNYHENNYRFKWKKGTPGFAHYKSWYTYPENPFKAGTFVSIPTITDPEKTSSIEWTPHIPETGRYAVYISYATVDNSTTDAQYAVHHSGGITRFTVNQQVNGSTWLYLGHFHFKEGNNDEGKVVLTNLSADEGKVVTADALKVGGGMGTITGRRPTVLRYNEQVPAVSGYPRFAEGARYWLQWSGVPASVYSRTENKNHYSDDFQSRGFWVNYLKDELGIPIDLALAFHTDAGIRGGDSIIGTLGICTVNNNDGDSLYSNGVSRWAARDMVDYIQTEIVREIRTHYRSDWTRRGIWNRSYSESRVPDVPTMLLELLSHQNFEDMKYALDPRFRFTVSRAIYKGILKHLAIVNNQRYVVQPLPVHRFSSHFKTHNKLMLKWQATIDTTETTAMPDHYILYTRVGDGCFDNGIAVYSDSVEIRIIPGIIHSFKIAAVNKGGKSFPSEILSAYRAPHEKGEVLIVNGFNRISGPEHFNLGIMAGFLNDKDAGVPYHYDISFTGRQYDFSVSSPYVNMDNPGFGASEHTHAAKLIRGNTFDYPAIHGASIKEAGYSFVSSSAEAVMTNDIRLANYKLVNFIAGKQKQTFLGNVKKTPEFKTFPLALQHQLRAYANQGGNLMVSGAYIASDNLGDEESMRFLEEVLHVIPCTSEHRKFGMVRLSSPASKGLHLNARIDYHTMPNEKSYYVEEADVLLPAHQQAWVAGWYNGGDEAAIVVTNNKNKTVVMGFPMETITEKEDRNQLFKQILRFMFND
jgi:hypothetical protein